MGQNIGVFDSGLGGLSVYREIKKLLPRHKIIYFADHKNAPYGTKSQSEIRSLTLAAIRFLLSKKCNPVVIACNTATTGGIEYYRRKFPDISFVGVVPPIKPAAKKGKNKKILILSTPYTSKSAYLKKLIKDYATGCQIFNLGCPEFVELVEKGILVGTEVERIIRKYLEQPVEEGVDVVVLGCTHFPFLKMVIRKVAGKGIKILDPSQPVASQVSSLYINSMRSHYKNVQTGDEFFTSENTLGASDVASKLLKRKVIFQAGY